MHLERRTVSRKTPRDGKLEISEHAASRLHGIALPLRAKWDGRWAPAAIARMSCTCGGASATHEHFFLESEIFRTLPVGQDVDLELSSGTVHVAMTPSP